MISFRSLLAAIASCCVLPYVAEAGPLSLGFDQTSYTVQSGGTVEVRLILRDLDPTQPFVLSSEGLLGGGGRIVQTGGAASVSVLSAADILPNPEFDPLLTVLFPFDALFPDPGTANVAGILGGADPVALAGVGSGQDEIVLGTFTLTVTGSLGDQAVITAADLDPLFEENVSFNTFRNLDGDIRTFGSASITVVPEPSTLALLTLGCCSLFGYGVRRRRKQFNASHGRAHASL